MNLRKTALAALVASALAAPAYAQIKIGDSLQIYGRVNVSYERITTKDSSNTAVQPNESNWDMVDNSSRVGFRGRKELMPGLTGFFQIESRTDLVDGSANWASRDSYAGLEGGWGTVRLGRTIGPVYYATYDYISMHNHDTGTSSDALLAGTVFGNTGFMPRTVWYTSPKFGGFSVDVAHSLLDNVRLAGESQPRHLGLVLSYDQGPLHLAVSHANTKGTGDLVDGDGGTLPNDPSKDTATTIGGLYDFKSFVVGALFERAESRLATGGDASRNYFRISAMVPVGKHELHANFGTVDHRLDADLDDDGANQWTLGYNYNITKETKVYAFFTTVNNDDNGNYAGFANPNGVTGVDMRSIAVGVRHNF
jgi:predicted porin